MRKLMHIFIIIMIFTSTSFGASNIPFRIQKAMDVIGAAYGDKVKLSPETLLKFGRSEQVSNATHTTLMTFPTGTLNETFATTNAITHISSSSASDTQSIVIEGLFLSNGVGTYKKQTITLTGQTKVALSQALIIADRVYNDNSSDLVGAIYIYEDDTITAGVPDTDSKVHLMIPAGHNQSHKAQTRMANNKYWIITQATASINSKTGSPVADMQISE